MVMLMVLSPLLATHTPGVAAQESDVPSGNVIVILNDNVQLAETTAIAETVDATVTFGTVLNGFAADLTPEEAAALADDPNVAGIYPDLPIYLAEEHTTSLGIRRVGAPARRSTADVSSSRGAARALDVSPRDPHCRGLLRRSRALAPRTRAKARVAELAPPRGPRNRI